MGRGFDRPPHLRPKLGYNYTSSPPMAVFLNRRAAARYRALASIIAGARDAPGICHFSVLSNFHELMFYSGNILRRKIFVNVSKNSDPDVGLRKLQYATRFH